MIKEVKNIVPCTYVFNDLNEEELIGTFYKKELQKTNQQGFKTEKTIKRKGNKLYFKWKDMINHLITGLIKKILNKNESILS